MYFLAILCPPEINKKVNGFKLWMKERFGCVVALKSPAHITMVPPFWFAEEREEYLIGLLKSFYSAVPPLAIRLRGFDHFKKRVLFIHVEASEPLAQLKEAVTVFIAGSLNGMVKPETRAFHPHVTIANRDFNPVHFEQAWSYFSTVQFSEDFSASSVSLLKLIDGRWQVIASHQWSEAS